MDQDRDQEQQPPLRQQSRVSRRLSLVPQTGDQKFPVGSKIHFVWSNKRKTFLSELGDKPIYSYKIMERFAQDIKFDSGLVNYFTASKCLCCWSLIFLTVLPIASIFFSFEIYILAAEGALVLIAFLIIFYRCCCYDFCSMKWGLARRGRAVDSYIKGRKKQIERWLNRDKFEMDWDIRVREIPLEEDKVNDIEAQRLNETPLQIQVQIDEEQRGSSKSKKSGKSGKFELYVELIFTKTADWDIPHDPIFNKEEEKLDQQHNNQVMKQLHLGSSQRDILGNGEVSIPDEFEEIKDQQDHDNNNQQMYDRPNNHFQEQRNGSEEVPEIESELVTVQRDKKKHNF